MLGRSYGAPPPTHHLRFLHRSIDAPKYFLGPVWPTQKFGRGAPGDKNESVKSLYWRVSAGIEDGEQGRHVPAPQNRGKYFSDNYRVKFGHFVNFSYTYFRAKMSCPPKLTELPRLQMRVTVTLPAGYTSYVSHRQQVRRRRLQEVYTDTGGPARPLCL